MDDIRLPMVNGTMDDISQASGQADDSSVGDTPIDSMSSQVIVLSTHLITLFNFYHLKI